MDEFILLSILITDSAHPEYNFPAFKLFDYLVLWLLNTLYGGCE
jgi:hypothetical protein